MRQRYSNERMVVDAKEERMIKLPNEHNELISWTDLNYNLIKLGREDEAGAIKWNR